LVYPFNCQVSYTQECTVIKVRVQEKPFEPVTSFHNIYWRGDRSRLSDNIRIIYLNHLSNLGLVVKMNGYTNLELDFNWTRGLGEDITKSIDGSDNAENMIDHTLLMRICQNGSFSEVWFDIVYTSMDSQ